MARLSNIEKLGFVPLPGDAASMIASYIAPSQVRIGDICAGEGVALQTIAEALSIPISLRYANEFHDGRALAIQKAEIADHVLSADALRTVQFSSQMFGILYINPPFDEAALTIGGDGRLEHHFFRYWFAERRALQIGGIAIMVAPQYVMARKAMLNMLAREFDQVEIYTLPTHMRRYGEVVIFGVTRSTLRLGDDQAKLMKTYGELLEIKKPGEPDDLPVLSYQEEPRYTPPRPHKIDRIVWRNTDEGSAEMAIQDLIHEGGAWATVAYMKAMREARAPRQLWRPIFPATPVQAAVGIAAGHTNEQIVEVGGRLVQIKGTTKVDVDRRVTESTDDDGVTTETVSEITRRTAHIVTIDQETQRVGMYTGDEGIARLMAHEDTAKSLIEAYRKALPARYTWNIPTEYKEVFASLASKSGRKLPGRTEPGYVEMQQHIMAAVVQVMTDTTDPLHCPYVAADMGVGKTSIGIGIAELMFRKHASNTPNRAYTAIVSAPNHLIGERRKVEGFFLYQKDREAYKKLFGKKAPRAKLSDISKWLAEWLDLAPWWHAEIIETPSQLSLFYKHAQDYPAVPHVAFVSLSKYSLGSGFGVGYVARQGISNGYSQKTRQALRDQGMDLEDIALRAERRLRLAESDVEADKEWLKEKLKPEKKSTKRRTVHVEETKTPAPVEAHNVSERTRRRDRILKFSGRVRLQNGVYCPRCGMRHMRKDGSYASSEWVTKQGKAARCWRCNEGLNAVNRTQDNVQDRELAIFDDWQDDRCTEPQRHIDIIEYKEVKEIVPLFVGFRRNHEGKWSAAIDQQGEPIPQLNHDGTQKTTTITRTVAVVRHRTGGNVPALAGKRPLSNPRWPLAALIARHETDIYLADECHKHKGKDTDTGGLFGGVVQNAKYAVGLTGTLYGGKASTVFELLMRARNPALMSRYGWADRDTFIREMGVIERITKNKNDGEASSAKVNSGRASYGAPREKELPGISADLINIIQSGAISILLRAMGYKLPKYTERVGYFELPAELMQQYNSIIAQAQGMIAEGGWDVVSSMLQALLTWPMAPWKPMTLRSKVLEYEWECPVAPQDIILPHHLNFAEELVQAKKDGVRSIIYVQHTNRLDITGDLKEKITKVALEQLGVPLKIVVLKSTTVPSTDRIGWFADQEAADVDCVICHPQLVETGIDLIAWPRLHYAEPIYSLYLAMQSAKRAYRPTQTHECSVRWWGYSKTMIETALGIIGTKKLTSVLLAGDDLTSGLLQMDRGMSLMQMLAEAALKGEALTGYDAEQAFEKAADAFVDSMNAGMSAFISAPPVTREEVDEAIEMIMAEVAEPVEEPVEAPVEVVHRLVQPMLVAFGSLPKGYPKGKGKKVQVDVQQGALFDF